MRNNMLISVYVINTRQFTVSQGDNFNTKSIFELPYFNCVFHLHLPLSQLIFIFFVVSPKQLQRTLGEEFRWHMESRLYNENSRNFLDLIQLKVSSDDD